VINVQHGSGVTALIAEGAEVLQGVQVGFQIFAGANIPAARRYGSPRDRTRQIENTFQIGVDHLMQNIVGSQARRQFGNPCRWFRGFRDGRMNENYFWRHRSQTLQAEVLLKSSPIEYFLTISQIEIHFINI